MAKNTQSESALPVTGKETRRTSDLLPRYYKTDANKKFFAATLDQLMQPGTVKKLSGYIGRQNAKSVTASDVFVEAPETARQNYQLEPAAVIQDYLGNITFFKDYIDHTNHIDVFGGNTKNHDRLNRQEFYSWNPHIDWDKFVNFQQYYWLPYGPDPIEVEGQQLAVESTYTVVIEDNGDNYAYIFTPDGLTRNPSITLFRGQTYVFDITSPNNPFSIKTARVEGDIDRYTNGLSTNGVTQGQIVFEVPLNAPDVLYYVNEADANTGGSFRIENIDENTFLDVNKDIIGKKNYTLNSGISLSNGMKLFFSGNTSPAEYATGYWYVEGVGTAIKLIRESDLEIIGSYTSEETQLFDDEPFDINPFSTSSAAPRDKDFVVINRGSPDRNPWSRYNRWFHQDVISTSAAANGNVPEFNQLLRANRPIIEFNSGLKLYNFGHKAKKNITLIDTFTTDVFSNVEGSLGYNVDGVDLAEGMRIIFTADTDRLVKNKIFKVNFIKVTVPSRQVEFDSETGVNITDDIITTSTPHGFQTGNQVIYLNNGNLNIEGLLHRNVYYVSVINDSQFKLYTDRLFLNLADIFAVGTGTHKFEVFIGLRRQINLVEEEDTEPLENETVLVSEGVANKGLMYWYNGTSWVLGQTKTELHQQPMFDIFDEDGAAFGDTSVYDGSTFRGNKIFSYQRGTGTNDTVLGFPLSYKNINNVGDIKFSFNLLADSFNYKNVATLLSKETASGFLKIVKDLSVFDYANGWVESSIQNVQPVVRIFKNSGLVNSFPIDVFSDKNDLADLSVSVFVNGKRQNRDTYTIETGTVYKFVLLNTNVTENDVVTLKLYAAQAKNNKGYYEIPLGLQNNPLNNNVEEFTLGEVIDHVDSIVDNTLLFSGQYPGTSNLRDLGNLTEYGTRFVQHSAPLNFALYHLGTQNANLVKALEKARDDYGKFKRAFLTVAMSLGIDTDPRPFVDLILQEIAKDKPKTHPYYLSDMYGFAGSKRLEYTVLDGRIKTYPLTSAFNLTTLSNKAINVYLNGVQLLHGRDYTFGTDIFFEILVDLVENDLIEVYEYESTDGTFCPPTPTKLGLYPLFEPKKYVDDTYLTPTEVIQGHDGSITVAYGDYRDDLILELETRIFNNIKVNYDSTIFNIYDYIPGYSRNTEYSSEEFNNVLSKFFYQWTSYITQDYTKVNTDNWTVQDAFTYNYRGNSAPDGTDVPAFWRGIYKWMLDTDRPHTHPWEMLGFSIQPTWWESVYGTLPYTRDNFILWDDLSKGIVREPGVPIRVKEQFVRPVLADYIPVDDDGNLLAPMNSSFAQGLIKPTSEGYYIFGDQGPVETAWRRSSYYAFSLIQAALLLHPSKVLGTAFDRSRIVRNLNSQLVYKDTGVRVRLQDLIITSNTLSGSRIYTSGLVNYIVDYITSDTTLKYDAYLEDLGLLTNKIASKLGGFTTKSKFRLLLDSKNPASSGGVFVPEENYQVFLNTSSAVKKLAYSGVIITKYADGYEVRGYIKDQPYFISHPYIQTERSINVGGISESFIIWAEDKYYTAGKIVRYNNQYYRTKINHQSSGQFSEDKFTRLPALPVSGGRDAYIRRSWNTQVENVTSYGTKFTSIQDLVDFLQGYGAYLEGQGFVFDEYNPNLKSVDNWETSVKELLFWTTQNWAVGSAISLSPAARFMLVRAETAVAENIQDSFYGYQVYRVDGEKLDPEFTNTFRESNEFTLSPQNTNHGVYGAVVYLVQKEHVLLLDNTTLFNDTIYDQEPGYRQERIKVLGYISSNWNGSFNVPGFIFDNAKVVNWTQWTDYNLGDTVKYKEFYYIAKKFLVGTATFENDNWYKLDEKPTAQLLPNWDYKVEQFTDFYDLDSDNFDVEQQKMAQHLIGYQKRQYLENIIQDDVSQYKFYQGMIIEKGTQNVFNKLFDVLSADDQESLIFNEEWAVRVGQYGASNSYDEIEFNLDESQFKLNPQPVELVNTIDPSLVDFVYRQKPSDIYIKPVNYDNNVWPTDNVKQFLRTPGYVRYEDVKLNVDELTDALEYDISTFVEGDYVWCAFEGRDWNIYRFSRNNFTIEDVDYSNGVLRLRADRIPDIGAGRVIGIENSELIKGFFTIESVSGREITIKTTIKDWQQPWLDSAEILTYKFESCRATTIDDLNDFLPVDIKSNELIWVDNNGQGLNTVLQNSKIYRQKTLLRTSASLPNSNFGKKVTIAENGKTAAVASDNEITVFVKNAVGNWTQQAIITPDLTISYSATVAATTSGTNLITCDDTTDFRLYDQIMFSGATVVGGIIPNKSYYIKEITSSTQFKISEAAGGPTVSLTTDSGTLFVVVNLNFGAEMCFSPDGQWLAVSAPTAGNVRSQYKGRYNVEEVPLGDSTDYVAGDVVQLVSKSSTGSHTYLNTHWRAKQSVTGDWSTINQFTQDWESADLINTDSNKDNWISGRNQGYVNIYYRSSTAGSYSLAHSFVSPEPVAEEKFGSKMVMAQNSDGEYILAVSSPGYNDEQGRVYIYRHGMGFGDDSSARWQMDYNRNYVGSYDATRSYIEGDIVFYDYQLYELQGEMDAGNPAPTQSSIWQIASVSNLLGYFPQQTVDTTTTNPHLVVPPLDDQVVEAVDVGDMFGYSLDLSSDGSTLVISAPGADQFAYNNFKGHFRVSAKYEKDDVVYYSGYYYKYLPITSSSSVGSFVSTDWSVLSSLRSLNTGKVFVYTASDTGYDLTQTLASNNLDLTLNDKFGETVAVSGTGGYIAVGSSFYDNEKTDAGRVVIFKNNSGSYELQQFLYSQKKELYERFGSYVEFMNDDETLVVFSANGDVELKTTFTEGGEVTFDNNSLRIIDNQTDTGRVDIFDRYNLNYIYGESLDTASTNDMTDRYGQSISVGKNNIFVGASRDDGSTVTPVDREGRVYAYIKPAESKSWSTLHTEVKKPNISKIKKAYLYDTITSKLISYVDVIDPSQGKIPGPADQEIRFKTYFDPAIYTVGTSGLNVDEGMNWTKSQVGMLWWDLTRARFLESQIGETVYRSTTWNRLYDTASIDIYEWVESKYLPEEWDRLSDTDKGVSLGITGKSRYGNSVYSIRKRYDNVAKSFQNTYYFWVKNPTIVPNVLDRKLPALDVANLIADPVGQNYSCIALTGANTFNLVNFTGLIEANHTNLNVQFWLVDQAYTQQNAHSQWKIISEHEKTVIPVEIERKWIDSLIGKDENDKVVPNSKLPMKQRYGVSYRPRQSMFVNRIEALKQYIERVNSILATRLIVDDYDISDLTQLDPTPSSISGVWDSSVDTEQELRFIGTARLRQAQLTPIVVDGKITGVTIVDGGYGYINAPYLTVNGVGRNASVKAVINTQGQVTGIEIIDSGEGYLDSTTFNIRPFCALVLSDSNTFDRWSIYQWSASTVSWNRVRSAGFDVTQYWNYIDWYDTDYNEFTKITHLVDNTHQLTVLDASIGDTVKVQNVGSGGWLLLEKYADVVSIDYTQSYKVIGRQNGTIEFSSGLYNATDSIIGFDGGLFDSAYFDNQAVKELRIIIDTIKDKILVDELYVEYLKLFFASVRYAFNEQIYIDWAFKTSFVKATHNAGDLKEKVTYNSDNLESFEDYIKEVKPYRTQVREYISSYRKVDPAANSVTDFDLPSTINSEYKVEPVEVKLDDNGNVITVFSEIDTYPWKHWNDHVGFTIQEIVIVDGGSGYISRPEVRIVGGFGSGAVAKAYISAGKVNRIQLISNGSGFLKAPTIIIDGGLSETGTQATAVAIIESEVVRSNKITVKFDRTTKTYYVTELEVTEDFIGTGSRLQWPLRFSPLKNIGTSSVKIYPYNVNVNDPQVIGVDVLREDYTLATKTSSDKGFTSYSGTITFATAPENKEQIRVTYTKDFNHLSAADRINFYYEAQTGKLGKDLAQLMTGIDYGGVNITGLGFQVSGGWDSLPFFTDAWDGFDSDFTDYIVTVSDSTYEYNLPYVPANGEEIHVYLNGTRIDDPYFDLYDGSTVQPNGRKIAPAGTYMKSIVGDGITSTFQLPTLEATPPLDINDGDKLIFRKSTSDGSYTPLPTEYDTQLSGGDLAYNTASGLSADDINVDGDGFVTPMTSHAPEEVVPGQVVDAVAIKVYQLPTSGASKIFFNNFVCDGIETDFNLEEPSVNSAVVFVKLDNLILTQDVDYTINWNTKVISLTVAPAAKKIVSIISFSVGSDYLLDTNYFVSDGSTVEFVTNAPWVEEDSTDIGSIVLVDGSTVTYELFKTDASYTKPNVVGIRLGAAPDIGKLIYYMVTADANLLTSVVKSDVIPADGSTLVFNLVNTIGTTQPYENSTLVLVDGEILNPSLTQYFKLDSGNLSYNLSPYKSLPYVINPVDCEVYLDGERLNYGVDYSFDLSVVSINISALKYVEGATLAVSNFLNSEYRIANNQITFTTAPPDNSDVKVISFYNHKVENILRTNEFIGLTSALDIDTPDYYKYHSLVGGTFKLFNAVKSDSYVWIIKNGQLLSHSVDYYLNSDLMTITLASPLIITDVLDVMVFNSNTITKGYGYMQFKDMLNRVHYKRLNKAKSTRLGRDLLPLDVEIEVEDGTVLTEPNASKNLPGVIEVYGERIEYMGKSGNTLSRLRRGTLGTGVRSIYPAGTLVQDIGVTETIPYQDTQITETVYSDGESDQISIGFVPEQNEIDVFVGGYRLKKNSYDMFVEANNYPYSPEGDDTFSAEFTADGLSSAVSLATIPAEGTRVTVTKKIGRIWTDSSGTLTYSSTDQANFIKDTETNYPEYPLE